MANPVGRDDAIALDSTLDPVCFQGATFSLIMCPPMPRGTYILLNAGSDGQRQILAIGRVPFDAPTLNLALIRQLGAELGALEVRIWADPPVATSQA